MAENYAQEKFYEAMLSLIGEGALRRRLYGAALYLQRLQDKDFQRSPELKQKWQEIMRDLRHVEAGPGDDGDYNATLNRMTDEDASRVAENILSTFFGLTGGWR